MTNHYLSKMSARVLGYNNIRILGLFKNGSQTLKQIYLNNEGFEIWDGVYSIDHSDPNLHILFPVRNEWDRQQSIILEILNDLSQDIKDPPTYKKLLPVVTKLLKPDGGIIDINHNMFKNHNDYFSNPTMITFLQDVFGKDDWKGSKISFFDLECLSTHIPKYLGIDVKIPKANTKEDSERKSIFLEILKENGNPHINISTYEYNFRDKYYTRQYIWEQIKKSKHWINFK